VKGGGAVPCGCLASTSEITAIVTEARPVPGVHRGARGEAGCTDRVVGASRGNEARPGKSRPKGAGEVPGSLLARRLPVLWRREGIRSVTRTQAAKAGRTPGGWGASCTPSLGQDRGPCCTGRTKHGARALVGPGSAVVGPGVSCARQVRASPPSRLKGPSPLVRGCPHGTSAQGRTPWLRAIPEERPPLASPWKPVPKPGLHGLSFLWYSCARGWLGRGG